MKLCSACLLGINCKYDGKARANKKVIELSKKEDLIPVCPEQLGGLPTPREPAEFRNGKVVTTSGKDFTTEFEKGAQEVLKIVKQLEISEAILKQRSPSCGSGKLTMLDLNITNGDGVTTALLKANGIKVISEEDL
jgi:uncharacterized protein YbbK (DUF523 family)